MSSLPLALASIKSDLVVLIPDHTLLESDALSCFTSAASKHPFANVFYADNDFASRKHRHSPNMKTAIDPILAMQRDPVGIPVAYRTELLLSICRTKLASTKVDNLLYEIILSATEIASVETFVHIPRILACRSGPSDWDPAAARSLIERRFGFAADQIRPCPLNADWTWATFKVPDPAPNVSIIIPTRDQPAYLERTVDSILTNTSYPAFEIIIVDNGTINVDALNYMKALSADSRVKIIRDDRPFNFARLNNDAARLAQGEVLLLLNNDMSVAQSDWLDCLVAWLSREDIGVVGAKLIFEDGRVQHAGVSFGDQRGLSHQMYLEASDTAGPNGELALSRCVSAVTGACLAVRASDFWRVGGLDESFAVAYNDVDLCFRIAALGKRIVYAANVTLTHYESVSRGKARTSARDARELDEVLLFWSRHFDRYYGGDPWRNPSLAYGYAGLHLIVPPELPDDARYFAPTLY